MRTAGGAIVLGIFLLAIVVSGHTMFWHLPSIIFVFSVGFGGWLIAHGRRGMTLVSNTVKGKLDPKLAPEVALMARSGARSFLWAGGLAFLIGVGHTLAAVDDFSQTGSAIAMALVSPAYSVLALLLVWHPLEAMAKGRIVAQQP
jgi:flagellar motor component MotA